MYFHKQNVGRNMNVRGAGEGSEGNGEHDIRNCRDDSVSVAETLAELWKA